MLLQTHKVYRRQLHENIIIFRTAYCSEFKPHPKTDSRRRPCLLSKMHVGITILTPLIGRCGNPIAQSGISDATSTLWTIQERRRACHPVSTVRAIAPPRTGPGCQSLNKAPDKRPAPRKGHWSFWGCVETKSIASRQFLCRCTQRLSAALSQSSTPVTPRASSSSCNAATR